MFRLRKWIIFRLVSIVDSLHLEMEEALTAQVARYVRDVLEPQLPMGVWPRNGAP